MSVCKTWKLKPQKGVMASISDKRLTNNKGKNNSVVWTQWFSLTTAQRLTMIFLYEKFYHHIQWHTFIDIQSSSHLWNNHDPLNLWLAIEHRECSHIIASYKKSPSATPTSFGTLCHNFQPFISILDIWILDLRETKLVSRWIITSMW